MTPRASTNGTPPAGVLVRYLDGEASPGETRAVEAALRTDEDTRAALARLELAGRGFGELVGRIPVPELPDPPAFEGASDTPSSAGRRAPGSAGEERARRPTTPRALPLRRAAAVVLLIAGAALAVSPVGAELARRVTAWVAGLGSEEPAAELVPEPAGAAVIGFPIRGSELVVEVENRQAAGALILEAGEVDQVTARAEAGSTTELVVGASGLRVLNDAGGRDDIRVGVPASVTTVRVRVGPDAWRRIAVEREALPRRVELDGRGGSG